MFAKTSAWMTLLLWGALGASSTANAALVTWTVQLDSRVVYGLGSNGPTAQIDLGFNPTTITVKTEISLSSTVIGPISNSDGTTTQTQLGQRFNAFSGVDGSPLSLEYAAVRTTSTGNVRKLAEAVGSDGLAEELGGRSSYTSFSTGSSLSVTDCSIPDCRGGIVRQYLESFQLDLVGEGLNQNVADVAPLSLAQYLDLVNRPNSVARFFSSASESTFDSSLCTDGLCEGAFSAYSGISYNGKIIDVTLSVPEPVTPALVGMALLALGLVRQSRRLGSSRSEKRPATAASQALPANLS